MQEHLRRVSGLLYCRLNAHLLPTAFRDCLSQLCTGSWLIPPGMLEYTCNGC